MRTILSHDDAQGAAQPPSPLTRDGEAYHHYQTSLPAASRALHAHCDPLPPSPVLITVPIPTATHRLAPSPSRPVTSHAQLQSLQFVSLATADCYNCCDCKVFPILFMMDGEPPAKKAKSDEVPQLRHHCEPPPRAFFSSTPPCTPCDAPHLVPMLSHVLIGSCLMSRVVPGLGLRSGRPTTTSLSTTSEPRLSPPPLRS